MKTRTLMAGSTMAWLGIAYPLTITGNAPTIPMLAEPMASLIASVCALIIGIGSAWLVVDAKIITN